MATVWNPNAIHPGTDNTINSAGSQKNGRK